MDRAIGQPCSVSTLQIGSTPNWPRCPAPAAHLGARAGDGRTIRASTSMAAISATGAQPEMMMPIHLDPSPWTMLAHIVIATPRPTVMCAD